MTGSYRIAGVGGQGVITMGKAISTILMMENLDPVMSEIHGLSQRGGSVVSDVKFGGAKSPILMEGDAEFLIGLKTSEAISNMYILNSEGICIGNRINPGRKEVVLDLVDGRKVYWIDCDSIAGPDARGSVNMVLLGFLCAADNRIPIESAVNFISSSFGSSVSEKNIAMLRKGYEAGKKFIPDQN